MLLFPKPVPLTVLSGLMLKVYNTSTTWTVLVSGNRYHLVPMKQGLSALVSDPQVCKCLDMTTVHDAFRGLRLGQNFQGRRLREQAGLSLRQMARILEIQPGSLSRWERGINTPRLEDAIKWAQACNELEDTLIQQMTKPSIALEGSYEGVSPTDSIATSLPGDGENTTPGTGHATP